MPEEEVMSEEDSIADCPVRLTVKLIGGKYKSVILWNLRQGPRRFSQIQALVPEATGKMITKQLRELEADGLIARKVYPVVPPKTEYSLTDEGWGVMPLIEQMCTWGIRYMDSHGMRVARCARASMEAEMASRSGGELAQRLPDSVVGGGVVAPVPDGEDGGRLLRCRQAELLLDHGRVEVPDPHRAEAELLGLVHHLGGHYRGVDVGEGLAVERPGPGDLGVGNHDQSERRPVEPRGLGDLGERLRGVRDDHPRGLKVLGRGGEPPSFEDGLEVLFAYRLLCVLPEE